MTIPTHATHVVRSPKGLVAWATSSAIARALAKRHEGAMVVSREAHEAVRAVSHAVSFDDTAKNTLANHLPTPRLSLRDDATAAALLGW